eukprot:jgi/Tetstr1/457413/TSEL_044015.t1
MDLLRIAVTVASDEATLLPTLADASKVKHISLVLQQDSVHVSPTDNMSKKMRVGTCTINCTDVLHHAVEQCLCFQTDTFIFNKSRAFLDLVANNASFSPTPEIAELAFSLDSSEWLRPHFEDRVHDISKPHKFEFTHDDAAASCGSLRTALWSNTPLSEPVQISSAPIETPEIRAGRPLLYALRDKKKPDALKVQRYLDDFKKVMSYITDLAILWHFSPVERESWKNLLDDLDEKETGPSAAFSGFLPQRKEEVDDFLREHGHIAPVEARHIMGTTARPQQRTKPRSR